MAGEIFGGGDEVGEGGFLVHHAAGIVPGLAEFAAAADVGHCGDGSAIDNTENIRVEKHVDGDAVGAVAVEIERALAVEFGGLEVQNGDGNLHAIGRGGVNLFDLIFRGVVSAGNFFLLEQSRSSFFHVVGE